MDDNTAFVLVCGILAVLTICLVWIFKKYGGE